jgi:exonuclease SbcD
MASSRLRVLLLADTHLGLDLPVRPRIDRRRRGPDFFANTARALQPALRGEVDLVVHGGDLLFRSRVPPDLVQRAMAPLFEVADAGVPVYLVPGNHERGRIPYPLLARHPLVFIFDRPCTFERRFGDLLVSLSGWPHQRCVAGEHFQRLLDDSAALRSAASIRLLCLHQAVQGARVGVQNYQFRTGQDVIAPRRIPSGVAALLSGHIHRFQVLMADLDGRPLAAPVLYPGAVERTSFAERDEPKGYMILELEPGDHGGELKRWTFQELPTRPMVSVELSHHMLRSALLKRQLRQRLASLDPDAVVALRCQPPEGLQSGRPLGWDQLPSTARAVLSSASLRAIAPPTMNVHVQASFRRTARRRA